MRRGNELIFFGDHFWDTLKKTQGFLGLIARVFLFFFIFLLLGIMIQVRGFLDKLMVGVCFVYLDKR